MLLDLWEATIMQAAKYMQSNSFKEDSHMIGQNFKVSYETYEQLGMDEYSISASNYLQGYSCGKELKAVDTRYSHINREQDQLGIKVRTTGVCIYPQGYFGGRELQIVMAHILERTSQSIFKTFWGSRRSSVIRALRVEVVTRTQSQSQ